MKDNFRVVSEIGRFNRSGNECIAVRLAECYGRRQRVDVRVFAPGRDGAETHTKKGFSLRPESVGELRELLHKAEVELARLGESEEE